jgi:hypothetical protein
MSPQWVVKLFELQNIKGSLLQYKQPSGLSLTGPAVVVVDLGVDVVADAAVVVDVVVDDDEDDIVVVLGEVIGDVSPFSGIFSFVTEDGDSSTSVALLEAGVEDSFLDSDSIVGPALSDISSELADI